ncbi:uncharacterized protein PgNI_02859 [Pyricularia grisea]|uniref:C2H2-type domain-containing protein n=1 Tax=Pyricularia grisea TaxID=148305 RepID=A0A6P8BEA1_PYRGI|nr:uncharacterized protein PgNI_02859 [Pyricularia grisea]TLD14079.1 hypothetical protein PgNI_02859 [Pyricularia grisea]
MDSECWECGKYFSSGAVALRQHCQSTSHTECRRCYATFSNNQDRIKHEADQHAYCFDCDRDFLNPNNARQHLNSKTHRGHSMQCPLCNKLYTTATGIVYHIESGGCPNTQNFSRDAVYRLVRSRDPQGIISKKLIGWTGGDEYEATDRTWNGYGYECYLCHRIFPKIHSLNQHLKSPAHQQSYYHCPNLVCRNEFRTLASLVNHLESESCGYMRFETVQDRAKRMILGGRIIGC